MKIRMNAPEKDSIEIDGVVFYTRDATEKFVEQLRQTIAVVWPRTGQDHDILTKLKK